MKRFLVFAPLVAGLILFAAGCSTVSETGRSQVMLVSPQQEMQLGLTAFEEMKRDLPTSKDAQANATLQRVGQRIAAVAELPGAEWEFVLFDSKEANAFCLPGGKIGVYTGLLPVTQTEGGLATVIGHEVAHAVARHGAERMSQHMLLQTGGQIVGALSAEAQPMTQAIIETTYGLGAQLGVALPHSRRQESEADYMGLMYMARAGFNPEEAVDFWLRFAEFGAQSGGAPWFLRTHPLSEDRIRQLNEWMPQARAEFQTIRGKP